MRALIIRLALHQKPHENSPVQEGANQNSVPDTKKALHNFAAGYAVIVPAVAVLYILSFIEKYNVQIVPAWLAFWIFASSFVMGVLCFFVKSFGDGIRALVFVSMLVSTVCGGLALLACLFSGLHC